jgi:hypothetical protein
MLVVHLLAGLVLGFVAALWGWSEDYSLLSMLWLYVLGGNVGLLGSAVLALLRSRAPMPSKPSGVSQAA